MKTATLNRRHGATALAAIMALTAAVAFASGCVALAQTRAGPSSELALASAVVRLLFAALGAALAALAQSSGKAMPGAAIFAAALAGLALFLAYEGVRSLPWLAVYPALAALCLGPRRGAAAGAVVGAAGLALARDAGALPPGSLPAAAGAYAALVAAAAFMEYRASGRARPQAARGADDRQPEAAQGMLQPLGRGGAALAETLAEAGVEQGEIVVLYRKEALETLERLPAPEAVFSYLLLEGLGDQPREARRLGDFSAASLGVEDLMARAETILEAREAKRLMEFNKIQTQLDAALARDGDAEAPAPGGETFERLAFDYNLSEREAAVARCILKGLTNKEISGELFISVETVKTHVKNLFKKCGTGSRIEFIKLFSAS